MTFLKRMRICKELLVEAEAALKLHKEMGKLHDKLSAMQEELFEAQKKLNASAVDLLNRHRELMNQDVE